MAEHECKPDDRVWLHLQGVLDVHRREEEAALVAALGLEDTNGL